MEHYILLYENWNLRVFSIPRGKGRHQEHVEETHCIPGVPPVRGMVSRNFAANMILLFREGETSLVRKLS